MEAGEGVWRRYGLGGPAFFCRLRVVWLRLGSRFSSGRFGCFCVFRFLGLRALGLSQVVLGRPLLKPASGSLNRDLIDGVYIPQNPPNPNSQVAGLRPALLAPEGCERSLLI